MSTTNFRSLPAFRVNVGDVVMHERRQCRVGHIGLAARFARRPVVSTPAPDPLLVFTLWPVKGGGSRTLRAEQYAKLSVSTKTSAAARWAS